MARDLSAVFYNGPSISNWSHLVLRKLRPRHNKALRHCVLSLHCYFLRLAIRQSRWMVGRSGYLPTDLPSNVRGGMGGGAHTPSEGVGRRWKHVGSHVGRSRPNDPFPQFRWWSERLNLDGLTCEQSVHCGLEGLLGQPAASLVIRKHLRRIGR
jgi:hypothetical protein